MIYQYYTTYQSNQWQRWYMRNTKNYNIHHKIAKRHSKYGYLHHKGRSITLMGNYHILQAYINYPYPYDGITLRGHSRSGGCWWL